MKEKLKWYHDIWSTLQTSTSGKEMRSAKLPTAGIALARKALGLKNQQLLDWAQRKALAKQRLFKHQADQCPFCQMGKMIIVDVYAPNKDPPKFISQLNMS